MTTPLIQGTCDPRFSAVHEAFADNFAQRGDVGAAVCVYVDGKPVVDLWGGYADAARTRLWDHDTIASVASTTKGMVALCAHMLVERGLLDLDAPVARYWPEFAQAGKAHIPVRWLLTHQAGLPAVRRDMPLSSLFDWPSYPAALAETAPWWEPGTRHGYHALTFGYLVGELIRRVSGTSVGRFFRAAVAEPLAADFFIGVPEAEDHRAAQIIADSAPPGDLAMAMPDSTSLAGRAFLNPPRPPAVMNTRAWRAAEIPSSNGHATARALARIYGALAQGGALDGVHLVRPATVETAIVEQASGPDAVVGVPNRLGLGFTLPLPEHFRAFGFGPQPFGPHPRSFGHWGTGGSVGFADLDGGIGFGYVMNQYQTGSPQHPDLRWPSLVGAIYVALGVR